MNPGLANFWSGRRRLRKPPLVVHALAVRRKLLVVPGSPHMHIVVYQSTYCPVCRRVSAELIDMGRQFDADTEVKDVLEHLEHAARLGITRPPAVVIDGRLFGQGHAAVVKLRRMCAS